MDTSGIQYCIAILLFCKYCTYCSNVQYWLLASIAHTMQYCNTDACGRDALCRHYVMSLFDRYMLQPATTCTEEALWAQYMNVLLMGMSFSGSSTLFTSVRAIPKSGPVQVSAILWILVCAILPFLQVLHIPQYVQYCLFLSIRKYPGIHASPGNIHLHTLPHSLCSLAIAPYMLLVVVEVSKGAPLSIPGRWER